MDRETEIRCNVVRRPILPAMAGIRVFAAVHIYLFHVKQAHDAGLLTFSALSALPVPLANLMGRGYISTGFFFELSGFLLAYACLDSAGRLKQGLGEFWRRRFLRLYPLYFLSLLLLIPAPALLPFTARNPTPLEVVGGVATSLTLTQAWFPAFALWWNAPAWASPPLQRFTRSSRHLAGGRRVWTGAGCWGWQSGWLFSPGFPRVRTLRRIPRAMPGP